MAPNFAPAAILPMLAAVTPLMPGDAILLAATRCLIDGSDWNNTGMPGVALIASEHVWTSFLLSAHVLVHLRSAEPSVASRKVSTAGAPFSAHHGTSQPSTSQTW